MLLGQKGELYGQKWMHLGRNRRFVGRNGRVTGRNGRFIERNGRFAVPGHGARTAPPLSMSNPAAPAEPGWCWGLVLKPLSDGEALVAGNVGDLFFIYLF